MSALCVTSPSLGPQRPLRALESYWTSWCECCLSAKACRRPLARGFLAPLHSYSEPDCWAVTDVLTRRSSNAGLVSHHQGEAGVAPPSHLLKPSSLPLRTDGVTHQDHCILVLDCLPACPCWGSRGRQSTPIWPRTCGALPLRKWLPWPRRREETGLALPVMSLPSSLLPQEGGKGRKEPSGTKCLQWKQGRPYRKSGRTGTQRKESMFTRGLWK